MGTAMFNVRNRKYKKQIEEKEVQFYRRIKKWRVDPSGGSIANPVPGEMMPAYIACMILGMYEADA